MTITAQLPPLYWWLMGDGVNHAAPETLALVTLAPGLGYLYATMNESLTKADLRRARRLARQHRLAEGRPNAARVQAGFSMAVRQRQIKNFSIVAGVLYAMALFSHMALPPSGGQPNRPHGNPAAAAAVTPEAAYALDGK